MLLYSEGTIKLFETTTTDESTVWVALKTVKVYLRWGCIRQFVPVWGHEHVLGRKTHPPAQIPGFLHLFIFSSFSVQPPFEV